MKSLCCFMFKSFHQIYYFRKVLDICARCIGLQLLIVKCFQTSFVCTLAQHHTLGLHQILSHRIPLHFKGTGYFHNRFIGWSWVAFSVEFGENTWSVRCRTVAVALVWVVHCKQLKIWNFDNELDLQWGWIILIACVCVCVSIYALFLWMHKKKHW